MAWRNLWRNRRRTLLTLSAIVFGVFLAVLFTALQDRSFADSGAGRRCSSTSNLPEIGTGSVVTLSRACSPVVHRAMTSNRCTVLSSPRSTSRW